MSRGRWTESADSQIVWISEDGSVAAVSGMDVWAAQFEPTIGSDTHRPSEDLGGIAFESSLHLLELAVYEAAPGHVQLALRINRSQELVAAWPLGDQLVIGGVWAVLDVEFLDSSRQIVATCGADLGRDLTAHQLLWLELRSGLEILSLYPPASVEAGFRDPKQMQVEPRLVSATLYPYQVDGASRLAAMSDQGIGALLADEMGLGKTMQAIYLIARTAASSDAPILVVVPASLVANWHRELKLFAEQLAVHLHVGSKRTGDPDVLAHSTVVISTYDLVVRDRYLLDSVNWSLVVLDEAQAIKNPSSMRSIAVKTIPRQVSLAITGTPIENSLVDMWSIIDFVLPGYLGDESVFRSQFVDELDAARELSRKVAPITIRRMVDAVATDLPERIDIMTPVMPSQRLISMYESVRVSASGNVLATLTKLRQACASPGSIDPNWRSIRDDFPKFERLAEIVAEVMASRSKILVFASFQESIDSVARAIGEGYPRAFVETVDGRKTASERQDLIDEYTTHDGPAVLVLNPRAAGVGLNIQAANYVVHFTPEWNPAVVAQASARAYRRGQTRPVFIYYLYYESTIEEVMIERLEIKRSLQDAGLESVSGEPTASDVARALAISPVRRDLGSQ